MASGIQRPSGSSGELARLVTDLVTSAEALAALSAALWLRRSSQRAAPPIERSLSEVLAALGLGDLLELDASDLAVLSDLIRERLRRACDLGLDPARAPGRRGADEESVSTATLTAETLAPIITGEVVPQLSGLQARLSSAHAAMLDAGAGAGAGALAIALCRLWPQLAVTGIDSSEPRVSRTRTRVEAAGLSARIALRCEDLSKLRDSDRYDLALVPAGFISPEALPAVLAAVLRATKPEGWLLLSIHAGSDALSLSLGRLRAACDGGTPLSAPEAIELLVLAGWASVTQFRLASMPTLALIAGRKPRKARAGGPSRGIAQPRGSHTSKRTRRSAHAPSGIWTGTARACARASEARRST